MAFNKLKEYFELVTFQHTLFALPFAYLGIILGDRGIPRGSVWFWVTAVMVGARTFGMGINRLVDHALDTQNPRTRNRPLPSGRVSRPEVWWLVILSVLVVMIGCSNLNRRALFLSPLILAMMWVYSYTKRFTWLSHFVLGAILGCAPILGWLAVTGTITWPAILLYSAVLFWVSGFDIIYATQDIEFDQEHFLWSLPALLGISASLMISRGCHTVTYLILLFLGLGLHLGLWYWAGLVIIGGLLYYQHRIISSDDLRKVNRAFFVMNVWVSVILFCATLLEVMF